MQQFLFLYLLHFTTMEMKLYNQIPTSPPGMPSDLLDLPSLSFTPLATNYLDVDFILSPCTKSGSATSTNLLEVLRTTRGKPMILHQYNLFQQRSGLKEILTYRCNLYHTRSGSCPATLTTDKCRSLLLSFNGQHNHPDRSPNTRRLDKHLKRHRLHLTYSNFNDIQKPVSSINRA